MVQFRYQSKGSTFSCYHPFIWNATPQWTFQQIWSINHLNAHHHGHFTLHQSQSVLFSPHPNLCRADSSATVRRRLQTRRDCPLHHFPYITHSLHYITSYYISTTHYIISRASHLAQRLQSLIILLQLSFIIQPTTHHSMQMLGVVTVTVMLHSI